MHRPFTLRGTALALAGAVRLAAGAAAAQSSAGQAALQPYVGVAVGGSRFDMDTTGATRADTSSTSYTLSAACSSRSTSASRPPPSTWARRPAA